MWLPEDSRHEVPPADDQQSYEREHLHFKAERLISDRDNTDTGYVRYVHREERNRSVFDWNVEGSTDEADDLVKVTTTNERIISRIYRSTISGPVVHWKARRKAQIIPRAKLRTPLPNFQRIFSSGEKDDDYESKKRAKKLEKRKKVIGPLLKMEPQMIRVKNSISPASHLHSEKIRISRDAAIFEIRRELPHEGAKFSSRYEIYNSTMKPFGKSYRELTLSSSASGVSSSDSQTSTLSSNSSLSETTTYITCSSEIEPVQMTGFQCIDETRQRHTVSILNEDRYDNIHEATNFELPQVQIHVECGKTGSGDEKTITIDQKHYAPFSSSSTSSTLSESDSSERHTPIKQLVNIDTWSGTTRTEQPLKSPKLLRDMITEFEASHDTSKMNGGSDHAHESTPKGVSQKKLARCRSLLNLELKPVDDQNEFSPNLTKPTSEFTLPDNSVPTLNQQEKERITKTISIMLENRQKQVLQNAIDKTTKEAPTLNGVFNEKLINNNIELVERRDNPSCRVTGELLKNKTPTHNSDYRNVCTLPRSLKSHRNQLQRHFYYPLHTAKSNNNILDEELPDPDKVKHARELFERVLKIGSLENVNTLPRSPQRENWGRPTPEIRQPLEHSVKHSKLHKCYSADTNPKWSDNGSISSGVGSDIGVETDNDTTTTKSGTSGSDRGSKENVVFTSSEEDLAKDVEEFGKPISEEILNNIRAYGTCVTYYGGKIIASSKGYTCSPMTMTIMNEIKQSSPDYHANRRFLFDEKNLAKFKLVKSNSCGSRLELSGTEDCLAEYESQNKSNGYKEDGNNNEMKREPETIAEEEEDEQTKKPIVEQSSSRRGVNILEDPGSKHVCVSKSWTKYEHVLETTVPACDMKFEEFEVLEESS